MREFQKGLWLPILLLSFPLQCHPLFPQNTNVCVCAGLKDREITCVGEFVEEIYKENVFPLRQADTCPEVEGTSWHVEYALPPLLWNRING